MITLTEHQKKCVDNIKVFDKLILFHSVGSGKTLCSLFMGIQFNIPIIIISTKSSKKNFKDDIEKIVKMRTHGKLPKITIYSYEKIIAELKTNSINFVNTIVIVDEAHRMRNVSKNISLLIENMYKAKKVILLTGTIFYNKLTDLSVLINICKGKNTLPESSKEFNFLFWDDMYGLPTNIEILKDKIKNCISYYRQDANEFYPTMVNKIFYVQMSENQVLEYKLYLKKILQYDLLTELNFYDAHDKKKLNSFLTVTRQLSNVVNKGRTDVNCSPKLFEIHNFIKSYPKPCVVYSNFLESGKSKINDSLINYI